MLLSADNHLGAATGCSGTFRVTAALASRWGGGLHALRTDSDAILEGLTDSCFILEGLTDSSGILEGLASVSVQAADKIFLVVCLPIMNMFINNLN